MTNYIAKYNYNFKPLYFTIEAVVASVLGSQVWLFSLGVGNLWNCGLRNA